MKKHNKKINDKLPWSERSFEERVFLLLMSVAEIAVFIVFLADIIIGENPVEIITLGIMLVISPIISFLAFRFDQLPRARIIMAIAITFVILPTTFFFGGGLNGGSVIWFSFAYLFIGLLITGTLRGVMLAFITIIAVAEYYIYIKFPNLIVAHNESLGELDSLISVILVGFVIYTMVWFQNNLYIRENKKSRQEARKVEDLSRAQSRFFSNMSHEIRTPINTIIGLNEMILREDISDEVAEDATNIQSAGKILLHLINDILDMSKIQSGQMELSHSTYNFGDMLSDIVAMLWIRAKDKGLDFRINVEPDVPAEMIGDEVRIKQILINVINNAIKYTNEGSVTLSVQCGEKEGDKLNVVFSVTDTGIGIKKESIPHLFNAFERVDEKNTRYIEGTGLGLAIVRELVDLMNGKITVNSVYTKGSTFIVEIPQTVVGEQGVGFIDMSKSVLAADRPKYRQKFEAPDARLLVVDDNEANLMVVSKLLRDTRVKIDTVMSGEEALKLTLNNAYDVIFMDHLMPEMDGIECHRLIRSQTGGKCQNSKIVVLTANAMEDNKALYKREGFNGYIEKPVNGNTLEKELSFLLPKDLIHKSVDEDEITEETMSWMQTGERKRPVVITAESVADLPGELIEKYGIGIIPHKVVTPEGMFRDGQEIDTDGLLNYMSNPEHTINTQAPSVTEHEMFFADMLQTGNNVVHISTSKSLANSGYPGAVEASRAFGNVSCINSRHLSSGQGLLALKACELADEDMPVNEILEKLEKYINLIHTSFVVNELDFLARAGQVSHKIANMTKALMIRPVLVMKRGKLKIGNIYIGSKERTWKRYIDSILTKENNIDTSILFVTYVGLSGKEIEFIREYIEEKMKFEKIWFQKAAPAIAVNCGAGTFGLLYRERE